MSQSFTDIRELLQQRADLQARLRLLPYHGKPEIKERGGNSYLYIRKRVGGKLTSTYVDVYTEELYQLLLRNAAQAKELEKNIRRLDKELAMLGYSDMPLGEKVIINLDFARANIKSSIYDQAVLEGVATTFPQTEQIIDNGKVVGMTASDVQKILNLKHAWEFILDKDVISYPTDFSVLCHIAKLVNEGFFYDGGRLRGVPVAIGGTRYVPPMPDESVIKEQLSAILSSDADATETAIRLCLYCMKAQIFNDGNKRVSVIFANHFLISKGAGLMIIPENEVSEFKKLLVLYYEDRDNGEIVRFMKNRCLKGLTKGEEK